MTALYIRKSLTTFIYLLFSITIFSQIKINEVQSDNESTLFTVDKNSSDWIEIKNISDTIIDLTNYGLSDEINSLSKWKFPSTTLSPNSLLIVFADNLISTETELHANFKLSKDGETLFLSNESGDIIDNIILPPLDTDQSYGLYETNRLIFNIPTPNSGNVITQPIIPTISEKSGFFQNETISLNITCPASLTPYYTVDGSNPILNDPTKFTNNILIEETTVLKSVCISDSDTSDIITETYFLDVSHNIPIVSISFDEKEFYDENNGIYVSGPNASADWPFYGANFHSDLEAKIHLEYFNYYQKEYQTSLGTKIFGGISRLNKSKSLRLIARKEYGNKKFEYPFFNEKSYLKEYDQLILRNSGNNFAFSLLRDAFNQQLLAEESELDLQAYQPVMVYFNGKLHGLMNLRERFSPKNIENNRKIEDDEINFLEVNGGINTNLTIGQASTTNSLGISQGTNKDFKELIDFVLLNDLTNVENFNKIEDLLDIDLYIDYFCAQIYHINWDWPHNNLKFYNSSSSIFRYLHFDSDQSIAHKKHEIPTHASFNELNRVIEDTRGVQSFLLKQLLTNKHFKESFINRMADFMNSNFEPSHMISVLDRMEELIKPDLNIHKAIYDNEYCFECNSQVMRNFILSRKEEMIKHINEEFDTQNKVIEMKVTPPNSGVILINKITPKTYPWKGTYFKGIPVDIVAIPNKNYSFNGWSGDLISENNIITISDSSNIFIEANFTQSEHGFNLEVSELNFNSNTTIPNLNTGDWIELKNNSNNPLDISGWSISDDHPANSYIFPINTIIEANEYLVVTRDLEDFSAINDTTGMNVIGNLNFGLNNQESEINIFDNFRIQRVQSTFNLSDPFLKSADGYGSTIQFINEKWVANCLGGTPGKENKYCDCDNNIIINGNSVLCSDEDLPILTSQQDDQNLSYEWYLNSIYQSNNQQITPSLTGQYSLITRQENCISYNEIELKPTKEVNSNILIKINENNEKLLCIEELPTGTYVDWNLNDLLIEEDTISIPFIEYGVVHVIIYNSECIIGSDSIIINLEEEILTVETELFPTPFGNKLNILNSKNDINLIRIISILGEIELEADVLNQNEKNPVLSINTSYLTEGVYLVEIHSERGKEVKRTIKVN